jgi:hypothetical protein
MTDRGCLQSFPLRGPSLLGLDRQIRALCARSRVPACAPAMLSLDREIQAPCDVSPEPAFASALGPTLLRLNRQIQVLRDRSSGRAPHRMPSPFPPPCIMENVI